jgi:uncharacterized damage-inducible protein DinB
MKRVPVAAVVVFALSGGSASAAPLTKLDRQRVVAHLEMTESWLVDEVSRLSPVQLRFRTAPGAWSAIDVVEHLTIAEPIYWQQLQDAVKAAPSDKERPLTDADILWYGIDRSQRQKTEAVKEPKQGLRDVQTGLNLFRKLHADMLQYARTTDEDLRSHFMEKEGVDAYQWLLGISTHEQRHILQIREIKADPKFPKM